MAKSSSTDNISIGGNAGAVLKSIVDRICRLEEEKKGLGEDIKDIYAEAKGNGFDTKVLRKVVKRSQQDRNQVLEEDTLIETYETALAGLKEMME